VVIMQSRRLRRRRVLSKARDNYLVKQPIPTSVIC